MSKDVKCRLAIALILAFLLTSVSAAYVQAATARATVTMNVTILPHSQLTLSDNPNATGGVGATASVQSGSSPAILTVSASNDSMKGMDIDPVAGVTATAADLGGVLLFSAPAARGQTPPGAAAEDGCPASYSETFNWYLTKSWSCSSDKNTVTLTYTLTSP